MKLLRNGIGIFPIHVRKYVKRFFSLHHTSKNRYKNRVLTQKVPSGPDRKGFGSHIDLKMKISAVLLLFGAFVLQANPSYAQKKISLNLEDVTVERLLDEIESRTDFRFIYSTEDVDIDRRVSVVVKQQAVSTILNDVFIGTKTTFSVENGQIFLLPNKNPSTKPATVVKQDPITVSGQVTNTDGVPMPGVSVIVKGTARGVATDFDGNYQIVVPNSQSVLVYTSIGYADQEITVGNQTTLNVTLQESVSQLDEVVLNAGYYNVEKKVATANISKVTSVDIEKQPVTNPLETIQGRMPGVSIRQNTGLPGSGFTIQIRGQNSLRNSTSNNGNLPFYVIDGVPFPSQPVNTLQFGSPINRGNPLNSINPADIESIEILKDADATAIYGSQGANGVVLITTKKGKAGKTKFDINLLQGMGEISHKMKLLNTQQYLEMRNEAFANDGITPDPNNLLHLDVTTWGNRYTDWQEELIGETAYFTDVSASVSGGNENLSYSIGTGHYRETAVIPGDFEFRKTSVRSNINTISDNKKFKLSLSTFFVNDNNELPSEDPTRQALTLAPNHPSLIDENGDFFWGETPNFGAQNPLARLASDYRVRTDNLNGNLVLNYQFTKSLGIRSNFGYNVIRSEEIRTSPNSATNPAFGQGPGGSSIFSDSKVESWIVEPQLDYNVSFGNSRISSLVGFTFRETISERESTRARGFQDESSLENIAAAEEIRNTQYLYSQYRYNAIFGRFNYTYKDRYILNLTGRRDGSSRFGTDNQFANFWAVGAAWIFSEENFLRDSEFLSYGKLRGSYGLVGSDQIGDYQFLDSYNYIGESYLGIPGLQATRIANPEFSWETTRKLEAGIELGFAKERIFFTASYFRNRSSDQLVGFDLAATTGFSSFQNNLPATVENRGWELELSTTNFNSRDFKWTTSINFTRPRNELIEYPDIENSPFANQFEVGKSLFVVPLFQNTTVDPETGLYTFDDLNDDGIIRFGDDTLLSDEIAQDFFGGFQNNIRYKDFELDFLFRFVKQTGRSYITRFFLPGFSNSNQPVEVLERWQNAGDSSNVQGFTQNFFSPGRTSYLNAQNGDFSIVDASFVRLQNISLSYNFPLETVQKIGLNNLRLYLQGQNLFTITNYVGPDPEGGSLSIPPLRRLALGVQVEF